VDTVEDLRRLEARGLGKAMNQKEARR
jgi:hypothetical protein